DAAFSKLHERGDEFVRQLWDGLSEIEGVSLFGPSPREPRTPTIAFTVAGVSSTDVARRLGDGAVFVSHGDFYASTVVERLGLAGEGLVRAGCACYSTDDEVKRLIDGTRRIARGKRRDTNMNAPWHGKTIAESDDTVDVEGNHYFPADSIN